MFACVCRHDVVDAGGGSAGAPAAPSVERPPRPAGGSCGADGARALAELSLFAYEYSPRVEPVRGSSVVFDASGLERLFGGPGQLAAHIASATEARGWTCGVALAHTRTAALLLAHAAPGQAVVPAGREARALAPLPVALLALADETCPAAQAESGAQGPVAASRDLRDAQPGGSAAEVRDGRARTVAAGSARHYRMAPLPHPRVGDPGALPMVDTLRRWGIVTIGDLAMLPRAGLHGRLGDAGVRWHRLAHGDDLRPLVRDVAEEPCTQVMALEWPIEGLEPLSFVLARLLEPLCARLERNERGAVGLRLWLRLVTRAVHARYLQLPAPIRDAKVLRTLLLLHLESHPPEAGIDEVTLTLDIAPGRVIQHSLLRRPLPTPDHVSTLVARLTALMGEGRCGQPQLVDSLRPGMFAMAPFAPVTPGPESSPGGRPGAARGGGARVNRRLPGSMHSAPMAAFEHAPERARDTPTPRTADEGQRHARQGEPAAVLRRYRRPLPARVATSEDGRPVRVAPGQPAVSGGVWRGSAPAGGAVREHAGPWRTSGEWWRERPEAGRRGGPWDRDEWDVAVEDGSVYRISRDVASGQWVVEGYWD